MFKFLASLVRRPTAPVVTIQTRLAAAREYHQVEVVRAMDAWVRASRCGQHGYAMDHARVAACHFRGLGDANSATIMDYWADQARAA